MAINKTYASAVDLPTDIPLFPLAGAIVLPGGELPLNIFEARYLAMFDDAMKGARIVGMVQPKDDAANDGAPKLHAVGCAGRITQMSETGDGRYFVVLSGVAQFRIDSELPQQKAYREARVDFAPFAQDFTPSENLTLATRARLHMTALSLAQALNFDLDAELIQSMPDDALVAAFAMIGPFDAVAKQALLEAPALDARAELLLALAERMLDGLQRGKTTLQ